MMDAAPGQLCARARFWASLRVDGELSELESALLDSHLGRCAACREYEGGVTAATALLRADAPAIPAPVTIAAAPAPARFLLGAAAAVLVVLAAAVGGLVSRTVSPASSPSASGLHSVAVVSTVETPDQLRRLRRTSLLNQRPLPPEVMREPY
jgi:putative zinc finger protein